MSFFDLFASTPATTNEPVDASQTVEISVGASQRIRLNAQQVQGKTLAQVFSENAAALGVDASRITRYTDAGAVLNGTAPVQLGRSYVGATNTETKGA